MAYRRSIYIGLRPNSQRYYSCNVLEKASFKTPKRSMELNFNKINFYILKDALYKRNHIMARYWIHSTVNLDIDIRLLISSLQKVYPNTSSFLVLTFGCIDPYTNVKFKTWSKSIFSLKTLSSWLSTWGCLACESLLRDWYQQKER